MSRRTPTRTFALRTWLLLLIAGGLSIAAGSAFLWHKLTRDGNVVWLASEQGAGWIRHNEAVTFEIKEANVTAREFRTMVETGPMDAGAVVTFRALRSAAVYWDGQLIHAPRAPERWPEWKIAQEVSLPAATNSETHELRFQVFNDFGPPLLLAHCETLGVHTGAGWEGRIDDTADWTLVTSVNDLTPPEIARESPPVHKAVVDHLPLLIGICTLIGGLTCVHNWRGARLGSWGRAVSSASTLRWVLWGAWAVLALNNNWKLSLDTGFDFVNHWEYINFLTLNKRIPLAPDGWQMFQSPLYYVLTAVLHSGLSLVASSYTAVHLTRLIPLLCGALQVELCYRGLRYAFPSRDDLQCLGLLLGGLLPMNLYISQGFGNEPLSAVFCGAAIVLGFRFLREPHAARSPKLHYLLGAWLGLGLLTKVSALLLIPPCCGLLVYVQYRDGLQFRGAVASCSRMLGTCTLIAGWYYFRNWVYMGQPFVGGWDPARGISWWQHPGYRTLSQFTSFGECLQYPICSSYWSIWDGIYSSFWLDGSLSSGKIPEACQWNISFMLAGTWLSLVPTAAMLIGAGSAIWVSVSTTRDCLVFSIVCVGIFFAALLYMNLNIPFCSHAKATVTLGLIPCFAALGAAGFDLLSRQGVARVVLYALMGAWAVFAYLAYFVVC